MAELLDHDLYVQRTALNATAGILPWLELDLVDRIERPRVLPRKLINVVRTHARRIYCNHSANFGEIQLKVIAGAHPGAAPSACASGVYPRPSPFWASPTTAGDEVDEARKVANDIMKMIWDYRDDLIKMYPALQEQLKDIEQSDRPIIIGDQGTGLLQVDQAVALTF
ncbi:hypothetical protein NKI78_33200 [Mesorhizobium sp. M0400]|uniref:hypothetical protein n=1 Tax=Mesorhizobium sp. M0400 TaxID=2956941 RepID=UPI00333CEE7E